MSTRTTTHLRNEHESARNLLGAFSRYLDDVEARGIPDSREPKQFIDYLGETFFQKHEEKEEGILLPELARMGLSWTDGSLAHVRQEHRQGRYFLRSLRQALRQGDAWTNEDRTHFLSIARGWIDFLEEHMNREERILFPYVDSNMADDVDELIARQFEATDTEYAEMEDYEELEAASTRFVHHYPSEAQTENRG